MWEDVEVGDLVEIQSRWGPDHKSVRGVVLRTETEEEEYDVLDRKHPSHRAVEVYWVDPDGPNEIEWFTEDQLTKIVIH
jgi:hypothetical protein